MSHQSLEGLLQTRKSPVDLLRNQQTGPNVYPGVPAEYTNWRDEQRAWQETCVLFNQSYHMADLLTMSRPDRHDGDASDHAHPRLWAFNSCLRAARLRWQDALIAGIMKAWLFRLASVMFPRESATSWPRVRLCKVSRCRNSCAPS